MPFQTSNVAKQALIMRVESLGDTSYTMDSDWVTIDNPTIHIIPIMLKLSH